MTISDLSGQTRIVMAVLLAAVLLLGACSGSSDDSSEVVGGDDFALMPTTVAMASEDKAEAGGDMEEAQTIAIAAAPIGTDVPAGLKVIRDGRVELRVEPGTFGQVSSQLRSIAQDLGGYITAGETYLQEIDDIDYTVGWLTMRIPEDRFDDAVDRVDGLGERLSLSMSSQDVTEEYVDLEGRLRYWETQEEFYTRLMAEATEIDDLVIIQTRMQDVLLNIEQIEGRLRYLDNRTSYSTLTVGLTEVPGSTPIGDPYDKGVIGEAIDQAAAVLLATIGGLIIGAAFALPFILLALVGLGIWMAIRSIRRRKPAKTEPSDE
ncbi:MAG: DUF4349 domain-containing protein [Actinomycetota bacterium]|nr:DUF4349 domain-containing protein [Actinomycetota bacterium]